MPSLRYLGDRRLMQPQEPIPPAEVASAAVQEGLDTLLRAQERYGGIGIAAPQLGWWVRAMHFGTRAPNPRYPKAEKVAPQFWVNPEIVWASDETNWMWEGCLSVPGIRGWVQRPRQVLMRGLDRHGHRVEAELAGLAARVAQHELDHLDGVLFPQRVQSLHFLVPQASMDAQDSWAEDWPSAGSRRTGLGELSDEA